MRYTYLMYIWLIKQTAVSNRSRYSSWDTLTSCTSGLSSRPVCVRREFWIWRLYFMMAVKTLYMWREALGVLTVQKYFRWDGKPKSSMCMYACKKVAYTWSVDCINSRLPQCALKVTVFRVFKLDSVQKKQKRRSLKSGKGTKVISVLACLFTHFSCQFWGIF